jgi:serine/threonine protein kinase
MNYEIVKKLGNGMFGMVYLVKKGNKQYAMKISHILEGDLKKSPYNPIWREIKFATTFCNKYPQFFLPMIEYDFIDNCKFKQKYTMSLDVMDKKDREFFEKIANSPYCSRFIYPLIDGTLREFVPKLSHKQLYSILLQLTYAIQILHKSGYVHADIHHANIGLVKTDVKNVKIGSISFPTNGYFCKLIDYGLVLHKNHLFNKKEQDIFNNNIHYEHQMLFYNAFDNPELWKYIQKNKMMINWKKVLQQFKKMPEYKIIREFTYQNYMALQLLQIMHPRLYQDLILGKKIDKLFKPVLYLPIEDILYFAKIEFDFKKVVPYLMGKLKEN